MRKLLIIGAGGHGRVSADVAAAMQIYDEIAFFDDGVPQIKPSYPIIGGLKDAANYIGEWEFFVAIGNAQVRRKITEQLKQVKAVFATLIHPSAVIGTNVSIEEGSIIMPGVIVNNNTLIKESAILNTSCSVDHDSVVGQFSHVSVGAHLCGTVSIGSCVWVGASATVINNIAICDSCMIGAGAVVVHDILEEGVYIGVPAKRRDKA